MIDQWNKQIDMVALLQWERERERAEDEIRFQKRQGEIH